MPGLMLHSNWLKVIRAATMVPASRQTQLSNSDERKLFLVENIQYNKAEIA